MIKGLTATYNKALTPKNEVGAPISARYADPLSAASVRETKPQSAAGVRKQHSPHQNVMILMPENRKDAPLATGLLDYFPAALAEVARLSRVGNEQHNPGQRLHWDRSKSTDQADTLVRHLIQRGTLDADGVRHSTKIAWRALGMLQEELELEAGFCPLPENIAESIMAPQ